MKKMELARQERTCRRVINYNEIALRRALVQQENQTDYQNRNKRRIPFGQQPAMVNFKNELHFHILSRLRVGKNPIKRICFTVTPAVLNFLKRNYNITSRFQFCSNFLFDFDLVSLERSCTIESRFLIKTETFRLKINNKKKLKYSVKNNNELITKFVSKPPSISIVFQVENETSLNLNEETELENYREMILNQRNQIF